jgi:hypothetical protein
LRPTEKKFHWSQRLIATNGIFAAPNRIFAARLTTLHRMVHGKNSIPCDDSSHGSKKKFLYHTTSCRMVHEEKSQAKG